MKKTKLFYLVVLFSTMFTNTNIWAQAVGDYGSAASGNWGTNSTWVVCVTAGTWTGATTATSIPSAATTINFFIRSGHTVVLDVSPKYCNNVTIESSAKLWCSSVNTSPKYLRLSGSTITNNGELGGSTDAISLYMLGTSLTLTGSGINNICRVQAQGGAGSTVTFDANTTITYAGGSGTGGTGIYPITDNFTININTGKTLTISNNSYLSDNTSSGSSVGTFNMILNVNGTLAGAGSNAVFNLGTSSGKTVTLNVGSTGIVNLTSILRADYRNIGTVNINIANGGIINSPSGSSILLSKATVTNNGTISCESATNDSLGTATISSTGILRLAKSTFPKGAVTLASGSTVEYYGSSAIAIPTTPATYENLIISNIGGATLGGAIATNGTLTINAGSALKTGAFTFTNNGTANINGSFQLDEGGWATGTTDFAYGSASTLIFNNTGGSYGVSSDAKYWPFTVGPKNVTVGAAGITLNAWRSVDGLFQTAGGVAIPGGEKLTINGQLQINSGGYISTNSPEFGAASSLIYNAGAGGFTSSLEWPSANAPFNVEVKNTTPVILSAPRTVAGTLTLTSGTLSLGANDLTIGTAISGGSATSYIVTDGAGKVTVPAASAVATLIPVGASVTSYDPVSVTPATATTFGAKVSGTLSGSANPGITYNPKEWTLTSTSASSTTLAFKPSAEDATVSSMIANSPYYALIGKATGGGSYTNSNIIYNSGTYSATFSSFGSFVSGVNSNATAITNAAQTSVNVYAAASQLIVDGTLAGDMISVYGLNGQTVAKVAASAKQTALNLNQGLYLVNVKSVEKTYNFKVILK